MFQSRELLFIHYDESDELSKALLIGFSTVFCLLCFMSNIKCKFGYFGVCKTKYMSLCPNRPFADRFIKWLTSYKEGSISIPGTPWVCIRSNDICGFSVG